ncbi:DNA-binding protein [Phyllobacterium sp. SYP-B3895]|uniref:DNA-binding protein n=1 Tax=Phyllobacterium sp. SYP-B3895 TaxID=2663240 RepID=UPI001299A30B|nr:DNA-binding protein [Phyllobacterium sp. SYP-B3895]MRG57978.1 DNA-binding protein [Phyllobacterium sp. SYP-B3895]
MAREHAAPSLTLNIHADPNSVQAAFLRRAMSALERISANASAKTLTEALAAPTDAGSLAQLLSRSDILGSAVTDLDPLVPALARNVEHRQRLLKLSGGVLSADEAGRILGITRQAVDKRRRSNTMLAIREGGDWRYPTCQLNEGEVIAGIADVVRGLASAGPWATLDFLLAPDTVLGGRSPLETLRHGEVDAVLRLVRADGSDGFA